MHFGFSPLSSWIVYTYASIQAFHFTDELPGGDDENGPDSSTDDSTDEDMADLPGSDEEMAAEVPVDAVAAPADAEAVPADVLADGFDWDNEAHGDSDVDLDFLLSDPD